MSSKHFLEVGLAITLLAPTQAFAKHSEEKLSYANEQYVRQQAVITYRELQQGGVKDIRLDQHDGTVRTLTRKSSFNQIVAAYTNSADVEKRMKAESNTVTQGQDDGQSHPIRYRAYRTLTVLRNIFTLHFNHD